MVSKILEAYKLSVSLHTQETIRVLNRPKFAEGSEDEKSATPQDTIFE